MSANNAVCAFGLVQRARSMPMPGGVCWGEMLRDRYFSDGGKRKDCITFHCCTTTHTWIAIYE